MVGVGIVGSEGRIRGVCLRAGSANRLSKGHAKPSEVRCPPFIFAAAEHPAVTRVRETPSSAKGARTLGASSIALISLAAVLTLRSLPSIAEDGWSSIAYYLLGALLFFIPLALVAAELATGWPRAGGVCTRG